MKRPHNSTKSNDSIKSGSKSCQKKKSPTSNQNEELFITNKMNKYSNSGIFSNYIVNFDETNELIELLKIINFSYYNCECIKENKKEKKIIGSLLNEKYKSSKNIILITICKGIK